MEKEQIKEMALNTIRALELSELVLDLDYQIPLIDISKEELEVVIGGADAIITGNKGTPEQIANAYLKKAQALQKIYECISYERIIHEYKPANVFDALLMSIPKIQCDSKEFIKELIDKALELSPDMPEALMQMGKFYHCLEMPNANSYDEEKPFFDEAIKYYSKAIELKPDYAAAYNYRANIYSEGFRYQPPHKPKNKNVFSTEKQETDEERFAISNKLHKEKTEKIMADYTEAIRLRPFDAAYYFNRGTAYSSRYERKKGIADYTNVIKYASNNFKKFTRIFELRGRQYWKNNNKKKALDDFSEYFKNLDDFEQASYINLPPLIDLYMTTSCFFCDNGLSGYSIGSNGLGICPYCLKKMNADMLSVFSITKEDIEKYKQERKNEEKESKRLPKIQTKTISKNKKIKYVAHEETFDRCESTKSYGFRRLLDTETGAPKDGLADRKLPDDKTCFACKRNSYVTEVLFMIRNNLWICPDCLRYIDINNENISALSITNEEVTECKTYLDTNSPEGKEVHTILSKGGSHYLVGKRIISWNSHYGFDAKKAEAIKPYNADILVIPECREMDMETSGYDTQHRYWYGDHKEAADEHGNINKEKDLGIGVFWKDDIIVTPLTQWENTLCKDNAFRYLIPFKVQLDYYAMPFTLITVWTKGKNVAKTNDTLEYVEKAHAALDHYEKMGLLDDRVVIIGDFNSNEIWDDQYPKDKNHTALVEKLEAKGIISTRQGDENNPVDLATPEGRSTFTEWLRNNYQHQHTYCYYISGEEKQVVDDYCFASKDMIEGAHFSVPDASDWKEENGVKLWNGSDHFPICVEMDIRV